MSSQTPIDLGGEPNSGETPDEGLPPKKRSPFFGFFGRQIKKLLLYLNLLGPQTPIRRLSTNHAFLTAGDAMITLALLDSVFLSIDPSAARTSVLLYLLLSIVPFAFIAPFIGPALDNFKGGRKLMVIFMNILRAVIVILMFGRLDSLLLFPLAFIILVLQKSYAVAKASIVPYTLQEGEELVKQNSKLAVLSAIMGFIGIGIALPFNLLIGSSAVLVLALVTWSMAAISAFKLPSIKIRDVQKTNRPSRQERKELARQKKLHRQNAGGRRFKGAYYLLIGRNLDRPGNSNIFATTTAMGSIRLVVGFLITLLAFGFRGGTDDTDLSGIGKAVGAGVRNAIGFRVETDQVESPLSLGFLVALVGIGGFLGSSIAPKLRRTGREENIIIGGLTIIALVAMTIFWLDVYLAAVCLSFAIGLSAAASKVGFDSLVQRDISDADYGKSFGGFETYFQLLWVLGALVPVIIPIPPRLGFLLIGIFAFVIWIYFLVKRRKTKSGANIQDQLVPAIDPELPLLQE